MNEAILKAIKAKTEAKRLVCVFGNFNILHPGHLRFLKFAAEQGDHLLVGVFDKESSPGAFLSNDERIEALQSVAVVDDILLVNQNKLDVIAYLQPYAVVKGKEFEKQDNDELSVLLDSNSKLIFGSGETINANYLHRQTVTSHFVTHSYLPMAYCSRHNITAQSLLAIVEKFSDLSVAVLGDVIIDEYIDCQPVGMSREDPTLVVSPLSSQRFVGAAGVVAAHAKGLGAHVDFYSVVGDDELADFAEQDLAKSGVNACLIRDASRPTTTKTRYRASNKTLLRVNNYRQHDIYPSIREQLQQQIAPKLADYDLIIFSDFNYGVLCNGFLAQLIADAQSKNVPMVADSQSSSQVGDLAKFNGMMLLTPTEHEARLTLKNTKDGLIQVSEQLGNHLQAKNVFITLGEEGMLMRSYNGKMSWWDTDELPALNRNPSDVAGAGDALLTASSLALAVGADLWSTGLLGALAAAVQVSRVGNVPIQQQEVIASIQGTQQSPEDIG